MTPTPEMNIAAFLAKSATHHPDRAAIVHGTRTITYAELYRRALNIGGELLGRGLQRGDRVAFALHNSPEVLETVFGCLAAGLVVVPMNARLHAKEMAYIARSSGARVLIHSAAFTAEIERHLTEFDGIEWRFEVNGESGAENYRNLLNSPDALPAPVEITSEDASWLFYTSGTTGRPKGATWTHRTGRVVVMNYLSDVYNIGAEDVVLHAAPLSHGSGIVALPTIARGATNVILDALSFSPELLFETVARHQVSHIAFLAPTQIVALLDKYNPARFDLSTLKAVCYGGAPIYLEHLKSAVATFGPIFSQIYGQGEAPITATGLDRAMHARFAATDDPRLGSAGIARTDVEVRVVDPDGLPVAAGEPGEIIVRGDVVMRGYWNNPEATAETLHDGWLHTGDVGTLDEGGYLFLLDRTKDMVVSGGNNVYPREVEEVLITHPAVADVVVFGIPDEYWGEAVHAVVVIEEGQHADADELIRYCADSLAGYKKPKAVEFVPDLPVSAYGKVLRREVRDRYWIGHDRKVGGGARGVAAPTP
ncbi:long-chain fatty acid--CoA ligase [Nocardia sp. NPDC004860]|uniref:class I adenylate-forming enzyme family protein n=1 Tax=Nocardia sp. NPDC004860 TaxID=3154557 RepID=UPI0033A6622A